MAVNATPPSQHEWSAWATRQTQAYLLLEAEVDRLQGAVDALGDIALGRLRHTYLGLCPDDTEGWDSRDPECPACVALGQHLGEHS